jgi:hypoxanthine phosphoribosyltransferase
MDLLRISWDAAVEYCEQLAGKIDFKPDVIVGISRGGLVPARILSDIMDNKNLAVLGIIFYKGVGKRTESPEITQDLTKDLKGKKVLVVDDVSDTGKSLIVAKDYIANKGASEIKVATLHYKPHSKFKPDYYIATTDAWIVYPWERHEVERELKKK